MGTRGFFGFVVDGQEKIAYNHWDSYPGGLGADVLRWIWANQHALICERHRGESGGPVDLARRLRVVNEESDAPTDEDIERLRPHTDMSVGTQGKRPAWYQLLRRSQGDPGATLDAGIIEDAGKFPMDSLMSEWGYLIDLDAGVFEVYQGFQGMPHNKGRFAEREAQKHSAGVGEWYPCALVASWPLAKLPTPEAVVAEVDPEEEG